MSSTRRKKIRVHFMAVSVLPIIIGGFAMAGGILLIIVALRIRQAVKQ